MDTTTQQERQTYLEEMEQKITDLENHLLEMEQTMHRDDAEYARQFDELREHVVGMRKNANRLREATDDEWEGVRGTMQEMWDRTTALHEGFMQTWGQAA